MEDRWCWSMLSGQSMDDQSMHYVMVGQALKAQPISSVSYLYHFLGKFSDTRRDVDTVDVPSMSPIVRLDLAHMTYPQF